MESIIVALISTLGVGIGAFLTYLYNKRQAANEAKKIENAAIVDREKNTMDYTLASFTLFKETAEQDIKDLRARIIETEIKERKCSEDYIELSKKYETLRSDIHLLELALPDLPTPMWTKSDTGVMLKLNKAYESKYLVPLGYTASDYIGKTDIEMWGKEIGKIYHENDLAVIRSQKTTVFKEPIKLPDGTISYDYIIKYIRTIDDKYVVGIGGMTLEKEIINMLNSKVNNEIN